MRAAECGFLLLSSHLGDPLRKPLSAPQLRNLALRVRELAQEVGTDWFDFILFEGTHEFCRDDAPIHRMVQDLRNA